MQLSSAFWWSTVCITELHRMRWFIISMQNLVFPRRITELVVLSPKSYDFVIVISLPKMVVFLSALGTELF